MEYEYKKLDIKKYGNSMYKNKSKVFSQWLLISLSFMFYINWLTIGTHTILSRVFPVFTFLTLITLMLINAKKIYKDKNQFFLVMIIIIITLIEIMVNDSNLGVFFVIVNFSLMLMISEIVKITKSFILIISFMFMLFFLYWVIVIPEDFNTNNIALICLLTYIMSSFFIISIKNKIVKLSLFSIITIVTVQLIIQTESRATLMGLIIFLIFSYIIPKKVWLNRRVLLFICFFITIGSLGFVKLYLYMWENHILLIYDLTNKKFFSGRQLIWYELWIAFKDNIIFGLGSGFDLHSHSNLNVHNSMYNILVIYGLPIFILILIQIWRFFILVSMDKERNKYYVISMAGFISIGIEAFFENTLISTNYLPIILFLLIVANSSCNNNLQINKQ